MRQHGTRAMYVVEKCRCDDCRRAVREYEAARKKRIAYGRWQPYVDATKARNHVRWLMEQGVGWKRVADEAGVPRSTMWKLLYGDPKRNREPNKRIRLTTGRKIMQVRPSAIADGALVDASRPKALLQVLIDNGWTKSAAAARLGSTCGNLLRGDACTVRTAKAIEALVRDEPYPPPEARPKAAGGAYGSRARDKQAKARARRENAAQRRGAA